MFARWGQPLAAQSSCMRAADLKREARLNTLPPWVREHLLDLIGAGRVRLCKSLPLPWEFALSRAAARHCWDERRAQTALRTNIENEAEEQLEPAHVAETVWQRLRLTRMVLPKDIRPGKQPR